MNRPLIAALALLAGCVSLTSPEQRAGARLEVEDSSYARDAASGWAEVPFHVRNDGEVTVLVPRCGAAVALEVERQEDGSWRGFAAAVCPTVHRMDPLRLAPGESAVGQWRIAEAGHFRLGVVAGCDCEPRIEHAAHSSAFAVR